MKLNADLNLQIELNIIIVYTVNFLLLTIDRSSSQKVYIEIS